MLNRPGVTRRLGSLAFALHPLLAACASDALPSTAPSGVAAAASASIGTVVTVTWKTTTPTIGYVSFGPTKALELSAPLEASPTTEHTRTLLGLAPDTTYYYRVITWDTANVTAGASDVASFHTAPLPAGAPSVTAQSFELTDDDGKPEKPMEDFVIVPFAGADVTTVGITDPAGALVWHHVESRGRRVTRARLSSDKASVLYSAISDDSPEDSEIVRVALDGSATSSVSAPGLGEDFAVLPNGKLAVLTAYQPSGATVTGDRIVEIDTDGTQKTVFSTFDCFDPKKSPGDGADGDWTHASALQVDSSAHAYYVALRNLSSIVKVDAETGECDWVLGDEAAGTLAYADGSTPFVHPGSFYVDSGKLVVLDADSDDAGSRGASYDLDLMANTATETHAYMADPEVAVDQQGEATLVGRGILLNWSNGSRIDLLDDAGRLKWRLTVSSGERLGYHTAFRDIYAPKPEGNQ